MRNTARLAASTGGWSRRSIAIVVVELETGSERAEHFGGQDVLERLDRIVGSRDGLWVVAERVRQRLWDGAYGCLGIGKGRERALIDVGTLGLYQRRKALAD